MNQLRSKQGFTLIEVMIVIVIIGILSSVAIPNYSRWKEKYEINGETKKVYFDLLLAHSTAISNNHKVLVTFDSVNHSYKVHKDINNNAVEEAGEDIKIVKLNDEDRVQFNFNAGVSDVDGNPVLKPISFASNVNTITFNSRGQASTSGSIFLIHKNDIGLSNNRLRSINIIKSTGSIESYEFTDEGVWR
jgi:prepilin-type N-terminal cleavage/methylation domain-containing protein